MSSKILDFSNSAMAVLKKSEFKIKIFRI